VQTNQSQCKKGKTLETIGNGWMWAGFAGFVLVALAIDLVVLDQKKGQKVGTREAALVADLGRAVVCVRRPALGLPQ
jgi:hypothetical protein